MEEKIPRTQDNVRTLAANVRGLRSKSPSISTLKLTRLGNKDGSTATPPLTTVTATPSNGPTVVGTYALESISSYASLKQSITTTVTVTTTSNGQTGVETAAAIVMAGGVAWFLAGFTGDAAAAQGALVPPPTSDGHTDDPGCPSSKSKCSDCSGSGGMCTTGSNSGCACDDSCPTRDQQPKCSDDNCKGDDQDKCTVNNKGCQCTSDDTCPEDLDTLFCDDCGGSNDDEKCKGVRLIQC